MRTEKRKLVVIVDPRAAEEDDKGNINTGAKIAVECLRYGKKIKGLP